MLPGLPTATTSKMLVPVKKRHVLIPPIAIASLMDANIMKVMGVVVEKGGVVVIINAEVAEVAGMDVEVAAMILFSKLFN